MVRRLTLGLRGGAETRGLGTEAGVEVGEREREREKERRPAHSRASMSVLLRLPPQRMRRCLLIALEAQASCLAGPQRA